MTKVIEAVEVVSTEITIMTVEAIAEVVSIEIIIMTVEAIVMEAIEVAEVDLTEIITMIEDSNPEITNKVTTNLTF